MDVLNVIQSAELCARKSQTITRNMMNGVIAKSIKLNTDVPKDALNANRLGEVYAVT
jgi:hypothetical protein